MLLRHLRVVLPFSLSPLHKSPLLRSLSRSRQPFKQTKKKEGKKKKKEEEEEKKKKCPPSLLLLHQETPPSSSSFRLRNPSLNKLRLRRIFDLFDRNSDGLISPSELSLALHRLGLPVDPSDLSPLLSPFLPPSTPGGSVPDGLDFDAFRAFHRSLGDALPPCEAGAGGSSAADVDAEMREAFGVFDEDGDGFISARELQGVLTWLELDEGESLERVSSMIVNVDGDHNGLIDFEEFKDMMASVVVDAQAD